MYRVDLKSLRIIGWACLLVFAAFQFLDFRSGGRWGLLFWFAFEVLGVYLILCAGTYEFDESGITYKCRFGQWSMHWMDLTGVEIGQADGSIVLHGSNKRLVLMPTSCWHGSDREQAAQMLDRKIEEKHIVPFVTRTAAYKSNKNTRVK